MPYLKHLNGLNIIKIYYEAKKNLIYITETSFPTKSANIINSVKFCDALSNFYNVKFFVPNISMDREAISKNYNLKNKIKFENLIGQNVNNFKTRVFFGIKIIMKIFFEKNHIILSRSIISSLFITLFNIKNVLELHHVPQSFSKVLFNIIMFLPQKKKIKFNSNQ